MYKVMEGSENNHKGLIANLFLGAVLLVGSIILYDHVGFDKTAITIAWIMYTINQPT